MNTYSGFTYAELVNEALKGDKYVEHLWHKTLGALKARRDAENECIKEYRKTNPGLTPCEVLEKVKGWLDKHYPTPGDKHE